MRRRYTITSASAFSLLALLCCLYAAELLITLFTPPVPHRLDRSAIAGREGVPFDTRTRLQVLEDLRAKGVEAFPQMHASLLTVSNGIEHEGETIFPLAGLSAKTTVFGNESGEYMIYGSDEHGFNNPHGLWTAINADIALIGDSFTVGAHVGPGRDVASWLRITCSKAMNLGVSGSDPLIELGILKEYALPLQPGVVLWLYYEGNDLSELSWSKRSSLLMQYLQEDFSQGLLHRQEQIDRSLMQYMNAQEEQERGRWRQHDGTIALLSNNRIVSLLLLRSLRTKLGLRTLDPYPEVEIAEPDLMLLGEILNSAKRSVRSWGGQLFFVYLPAYRRYSETIPRDVRDALYLPRRYAEKIDDSQYLHRRTVLSLVAGLGIPVMDVHNTFALHPDPSSLFPFRVPGHYTAEGYRLVAETIDGYLRHAGHCRNAKVVEKSGDNAFAPRDAAHVTP